MATLNVTANVSPAIEESITSDPAGVKLSAGEGTDTATMSLGNLQAQGGTTEPGESITPDPNGFTVSTVFDFTVSQSNQKSPTFTLLAAVGTADGNQWTLDGQLLGPDPVQLLSDGVYGSVLALSLVINVQQGAGQLNNTISLTVKPN